MHDLYRDGSCKELGAPMLLHYGGFCNICITKQCLNNSTNAFFDKKMKVINNFMILSCSK